MPKFGYVGDLPGTRSGDAVAVCPTATGLRLRWGTLFRRRERHVAFDEIVDARIFTGREISRGQRSFITDFRAAWVLDAHYLLIRLCNDAGPATFALRGRDTALRPLARTIREGAQIEEAPAKPDHPAGS